MLRVFSKAGSGIESDEFIFAKTKQFTRVGIVEVVFIRYKLMSLG